jgi:hypothetical protein
MKAQHTAKAAAAPKSTGTKATGAAKATAPGQRHGRRWRPTTSARPRHQGQHHEGQHHKATGSKAAGRPRPAAPLGRRQGDGPAEQHH